MAAIVLYHVGTCKRMHRFCRLDKQADLFRQWCVMRELGRIGGQLRSVSFAGLEERWTVLDEQHRVTSCGDIPPGCQFRVYAKTEVPEERDLRWRFSKVSLSAGLENAPSRVMKVQLRK